MEITMRVKSFTVGLDNGVKFCMEKLDRWVMELGEIDIHSVVDTVRSAKINKFNPPPGFNPIHGIHGNVIVRVIVYTPIIQ